jgi:hypothetical protein
VRLVSADARDGIDAAAKARTRTARMRFLE